MKKEACQISDRLSFKYENWLGRKKFANYHIFQVVLGNLYEEYAGMDFWGYIYDVTQMIQSWKAMIFSLKRLNLTSTATNTTARLRMETGMSSKAPSTTAFGRRSLTGYLGWLLVRSGLTTARSATSSMSIRISSFVDCLVYLD